ncbi:CDP-glycerol glycerophosphotransferase family protein [Streptomyces sp. XY431]|uniref:CDP-glycerol glycerophosphotransferase family protein n=1 Tax=Streptomyces sp. XY431 TaxID=1415562 RepID=UPI00099BC263|nr:CDP-glycerol glycerophosphotransferase family protein [Streptomyces sp. XY431]
MKQIGHDFEKVWFTDAHYLKGLAKEVPNWSLLLAGSTWAAPVLRRAFDFKGEILESGLPRNDVFFAADKEKTAERVRERLGLPEGKKVVLYAPTWREDRRRHYGGYQLHLQLDLEAAQAALGDDQVLLVRRHACCWSAGTPMSASRSRPPATATSGTSAATRTWANCCWPRTCW